MKTDVDTHIPVLVDTVDRDTLHAFQEGIAGIIRVPTLICDARGRPLVDPSDPSGGWSALRARAAGRRRLEHLCRLCILDDPSALSGPLVFSSARIMFQQHCLGAVIAGGLPAAPLTGNQLKTLCREFAIPDRDQTAVKKLLAPWSVTQQKVAGNLTQLMANVVARLVTKTFELKHREGELNTVNQLAALLSGNQDLEKVLGQMARKVCEAMKATACSIRLLDVSGSELQIKAVHNLSQKYLSKGRITLAENPIDRAAISGEAVYIKDVTTDPRIRFRRQARKEGIVSGLVVGLQYRGKSVGVMRVYTDHPHRFSGAEVALMRSLSSQAAAAITHGQLYLEAIEARQYQYQLMYAGDIQRRMIPKHPPSHPHVELACAYEPSSDVGGDFYDFYSFTDSDEIGMSIADVVGKGVPAALLMASLRTAFRLYVYSVAEITEVMTMINIHMCRESRTSEFATLFYGQFSADARSLTFSNAGHDPPLLYRGGKFTSLSNGGFVIGVEENESFTKKTIALRRNDLIVMYTDGIVDAQDFNGVSFGRDRLRSSIQAHASEPPQRMLQHILWDVRRFIGLAHQVDDITLVIARVR